MTTISRAADVPFSPTQMYQLVNDIEKYPEFLQWCESSKVHTRTDDEVRATLTLAKGGLRKSFTTLNRLQKDKMVEVRLISGPFKHLEGFWRFELLENNLCRISFDLEFEFINKLLSLALGPVFSQIANALVGNFVKRAQQLYVGESK